MTEGIFIDVLKRFQRVEIYASAVNDRFVTPSLAGEHGSRVALVGPCRILLRRCLSMILSPLRFNKQ